MEKAQILIQEWIANEDEKHSLFLFDLGLDELPTNLPTNLKYLYCNDNYITKLENLPPNLEELDCGGNLITELPTNLPNNLKSLVCDDNKITTLPELPHNLLYLHCNRNNLSFLPKLPNTLIDLKCSSNKITTIVELPPTLEELNCSSNQLTTLPKLPNTLANLNCSYNNQITRLPQLSPSLRAICCYHTSITALPEYLPKSMKYFHINTKDLLYIPESYLTYDIMTYPDKYPQDMPRYFDDSDNKQFTRDLYTHFQKNQEKEKQRTKKRVSEFKEELIARTWHPDRVVDWCGAEF
jgi:hypothetical protein